MSSSSRQKRDPLIGEVLQNSYRIERVVGVGGMGTVYEAQHLRLEKRFAVKMLSDTTLANSEALARFKREALVTGKLGHPHILEILDFNETSEGNPYILMEYLDGEDLGTRLKREKTLSLRQTASIFRQVSDALGAVHQNGIVHRDLKPQNIFLCNRGHRNDYVKLVDFGISKVLGTQHGLTKTNALIGTPYYMSPEQAEEKSAQVDERTDIYSVGVILYEMLTGTPPFTAQTIPGLLFKITTQEPPSLRAHHPEIPKAIDSVILKSMAKHPEERYASIDAFWKAFSAAVKGDNLEITLDEKKDESFEESTEDRYETWHTPATKSADRSEPNLELKSSSLSRSSLSSEETIPADSSPFSSVSTIETALPELEVAARTTLSSSATAKIPLDPARVTSQRNYRIFIGGGVVAIFVVGFFVWNTMISNPNVPSITPSLSSLSATSSSRVDAKIADVHTPDIHVVDATPTSQPVTNIATIATPSVTKEKPTSQPSIKPVTKPRTLPAKKRFRDTTMEF